MRRSTTLMAALFALTILGVAACEESKTICTEELACASQGEGLISTCCTELAEDQWQCEYTTPDGTVFECEEISDEMTAGKYCEEAAEALQAHCALE